MIPSFAYGLPTPAPTPESFRPELVERLRQHKKAKYDYKSSWELESLPSEVESEDEYSGAPPTPESLDDIETITTGQITPRLTDSVTAHDAVEYAGAICVGAEWFVLKDSPSTIPSLVQRWNATWAGYGNPDSSTRSPSLSEYSGNSRRDLLSVKGCSRFASETIANQHFRKVCLGDQDIVNETYAVKMQPVDTKSCSTMAEILQAGNTA